MTVFHIHPVFKEHCGATDGVSTTDSRHVTCPVCRDNIDNQTLQSGDTFTFNFPRVKFCDSNGIMNQLAHIRSEVAEVTEAAYTPDIHHTAIEAMDCLHCVESLLRILREKYGINLNEIRRETEAKNRERKYY